MPKRTGTKAQHNNDSDSSSTNNNIADNNHPSVAMQNIDSITDEDKRLSILFSRYYNTDKRHRIEMQWFGHSMTNDQQNPCFVDILVSSRKLKNEESSPPEVLFKTHSYELRLVPNENFFQWNGGRRSGYIVELKLFKKVVKSSNKKKTTNNTTTSNSQEDFAEHCDKGVPLISYTFTEDVFTNTWILNLIWPDERTKTSFRGDFFFKISVFRKVDDDTFRRIFSRVSTRFKIVSKPGVYLSKKRKKESEEEELETKKLKDNTAPPLHLIPSNPTHLTNNNNNNINLPTLNNNNIIVNTVPLSPTVTSTNNQITNHLQEIYQGLVFSDNNREQLEKQPLDTTVNNNVINNNNLSVPGNNTMELLQQHKFLESLDLISPMGNTQEFLKHLNSVQKSSLSSSQEFLNFLNQSQLNASQQPLISTTSTTTTTTIVGSSTANKENEPPSNTEDYILSSPLSPITPTGIFGSHQPVPQKGVLSLSFSQEQLKPSSQDWSFFNSQEEEKDDFYLKMFGNENKLTK
ncbi:hypothetical protein ABK040_002611 [Willaertia magna]